MIVVTCACGQKNRAAFEFGKVTVCGACKKPLPLPVEDCGMGFDTSGGPRKLPKLRTAYEYRCVRGHAVWSFIKPIPGALIKRVPTCPTCTEAGRRMPTTLETGNTKQVPARRRSRV